MINCQVRDIGSGVPCYIKTIIDNFDSQPLRLRNIQWWSIIFNHFLCLINLSNDIASLSRITYKNIDKIAARSAHLTTNIKLNSIETLIYTLKLPWSISLQEHEDNPDWAIQFLMYNISIRNNPPEQIHFPIVILQGNFMIKADILKLTINNRAHIK